MARRGMAQHSVARHGAARHDAARHDAAARRSAARWTRLVATRCGSMRRSTGLGGLGRGGLRVEWRAVARRGAAWLRAARLSLRPDHHLARTTASSPPLHPPHGRTFQICVARDESVSTPVGCLCGALWMLVTLLGNGFCVGRGSARSESLHAHAHRMLIATSMYMYMCVNGSCVQVLPETAAKNAIFGALLPPAAPAAGSETVQTVVTPQQAYQQIRAVSCNVGKKRDLDGWKESRCRAF